MQHRSSLDISMTIRLDSMFEIYCHGDILPCRWIEPATPGLQIRGPP